MLEALAPAKSEVTGSGQHGQQSVHRLLDCRGHQASRGDGATGPGPVHSVSGTHSSATIPQPHNVRRERGACGKASVTPQAKTATGLHSVCVKTAQPQ